MNLLRFGSGSVQGTLLFSGLTYETTPSMCSYKGNLASVNLRSNFVNDDPIREWVCVFIKPLWVIKYAIHYRPISEWAFILAKLPWVVNQSTNCVPIRQWAFIFAKLLWGVKYSTSYESIRKWASILRKIRVHLR